MREAIAKLVAAGSMALMVGCGAGGLSQEDMRRHAIRRPSDDDDPPKKSPASKPPTKPDPAAGNIAASPQTGQDQPATKATPPDAASASSATPVVDATGSEPTNEVANEGEAKVAPADKPLGIRKPELPLSLVERRQRTIDNLTKIGDALRRYSKENGRLLQRALTNSNGQPTLSWRVELLPYLGYESLFNKFDLAEPWDSPRNKPLLQLMPPEYQSPERFDESTNYLVPVASFTPFARTRGIGTRNIEDGVENTIAIVEANEANAVPWTQPADFALNMKTVQYQLGQLRQDGFFAVWADGTVSRVKHDAGTANLKAIFSYDGGDFFTSHLVRATAQAVPEVTVAAGQDDSTEDAPAVAAATNLTGSKIARPRSDATERPSTSKRKSDRMQVPDARSLDRARALVREVFEEDYQNATSFRAQQALAKKMLQQASDLEDDPAGQYMTLDIAIQIATQSGDSTTAISAMEEMLSRFELGATQQLELQHDILQQLAKRRDRGRGINQTLLDQAEDLVENAIQAEEFDTAESLCKIALGAARQMQDSEAENEIETLMRTVVEARNAYRVIHRTISNLEDGEDPKANLDVGRYYCLIRSEWDKGLPLLTKSNHRILKDLAESELRNPSEGRDQIALADGWWEFSENEPSHRKAIRLHAVDWYQRAAEHLPQGLLKVKAEMRIQQVERDYGT